MDRESNFPYPDFIYFFLRTMKNLYPMMDGRWESLVF